MTILAAGTAGAGTSPAGLWEDTTEYTGRPDSSTLSPYHDTSTRGLVYDDASGQLRQVSGVRQRVALTILTIAGTSSVQPEWGIRRPTKMGSAYEQEREQAVRDALRDLVADGSIRIDSIATERDVSRSRTTVVYQNLQTDEQELAEVI